MVFACQRVNAKVKKMSIWRQLSHSAVNKLIQAFADKHYVPRVYGKDVASSFSVGSPSFAGDKTGLPTLAENKSIKKNMYTCLYVITLNQLKLYIDIMRYVYKLVLALEFYMVEDVKYAHTLV